MGQQLEYACRSLPRSQHGCQKTNPLSECEVGKVYKLHSRNLLVGVFDGHHGLIGIREKFYDFYLDTEYHFDINQIVGTAHPLELIGEIVQQDGLPLLKMSLHVCDHITGRPVGFSHEPGNNRLGLKGWYFADTDEASSDIRAEAPFNHDLFNQLLKLDPSTAAERERVKKSQAESKE